MMENTKPVLLVGPPVAMTRRYGRLSRVGNTMPSLGLCFLAAVIRQAGYQVEICEASSLELTLHETLKRIIQIKPAYLGMTATTLTITTVGWLAREVKKRLPDTLVIVGGAHLTAVPQETLGKFPQIDIGVIGEGEATMVELLDVLEKGKSLRQVQGIIFRGGRKIFQTPPRPYIQNLDGLPLPAWDLLPNFPHDYNLSANSHLKYPVATLMISRGCTGQCIFCDRSVFGRQVRAFSAQRVVEMMEHLVREYGVRDIQIFDDNFALFPQRLKVICQNLIAKKLDLIWSCQARCDMVNPQILRLMKKAGCWQIGYGIESGNQQILDVLLKKESVGQMSQTLEWTKQAGIETKGFFILGNPTETKESLNDTLNFILTAPLDYAHTTFFTPYPGSEIYPVINRYGKLLSKDWSKIGQGTTKIIFTPSGLTKKILEASARKIFWKFYFRPRSLFYHLVKCWKYPALTGQIFAGLWSIMGFIWSRPRR